MATNDELRAEIMRRLQAANRKVNRLKNKGVAIEGTKYDVRRPDAKINRYNNKQLTHYLGEINGFVHRSNAFVGGVRGVPIRRATWNKLNRAQRRGNQFAEKNFQNIKDIVISPNGMTVGQREAATRSDFPMTANPASNSPFRKIERKPNNIAGERAAIKLMKQHQQRVTEEHIGRFVRQGKKELRQMLKDIGRPDIWQRVTKLDEKQFHLLWGWTEFARDISQEYEEAKLLKAGKSNRGRAEASENTLAEAEELIDFIGRVK
ncbi:hypothetical protein QEJ61_gp02 [Curtobacterium phage Pize]|uniref:hypothetical protein n=1 Tax=Curtobacterium phage Pize TaxID=2851068 RepID=UPI0021FF49B3|nr:hypothetical protein QEJ61_gp02 [Curtobacterium phage Pize]QXG07734.1 hypothetical protein [Curtobacterium phage Pize]